MIRALKTAATGMSAQETRIDVIANNLANVNTTGFKKSRGEFQDLLYETIRPAGARTGAGNQAPQGLEVGQGVRMVATTRQHTLGALKQTGNPFDLAIEGSGFFQVRRDNGELAYTRDGSFRADAEGRLVTNEGLQLDPSITLPADATQFAVTSDGTVSAVRPGDTDPVEIGKIEVATFINAAGMQSMGHIFMFPPLPRGLRCWLVLAPKALELFFPALWSPPM